MTDPREIEALALRIGSAAADWNRYLNSTRGYDPMAPVQSVTDALDTASTALRALAAENAELRGRLRVVCQKAVAVVGATGPTSAEDAVDALAAQLAAARAEVERLRRNTPTCGVCDNEAVLIVIGSKQREGKARLVRMMRCLTCWEKMNQSLYRTVPLAAIDAAKGGA